MTGLEQKILKQEYTLQNLEERVEELESMSWYKSKNFWAGLFAIPAFIALGHFVDFLSKNPHFNNMFHSGIGTSKFLFEELKSNSSEVRTTIHEMILNSKKGDAYGDSIELGIIKPEYISNCLSNLNNTDESINPNLILVEEDEGEGVEIKTSEHDCTDSSKASVQFRNSVFSTVSKDKIDLYLAINVSQLVFKDSTNIPVYVDVTHSLTPEKILETIKFRFDNGNDLTPVYDGASSKYKVGEEYHEYALFSIKGTKLPTKISISDEYFRVLNVRLENGENEVEKEGNLLRYASLILIRSSIDQDSNIEL